MNMEYTGFYNNRTYVKLSYPAIFDGLIAAEFFPSRIVDRYGIGGIITRLYRNEN